MKGSHLTSIQYFALVYSLSMESRRKLDYDLENLKTWTLIFNPTRFREAFMPGVPDTLEQRQVEGLGVTPDEFTDINKYLEDIDKIKTTRGLDGR